MRTKLFSIPYARALTALLICASTVGPASPPASDSGETREGEEVRRTIYEEAGANVLAEDRQFNLLCDIQGATVVGPNPNEFVGNPGARSWSDSFELIVDLDAMQSCYANLCASAGPHPIASVDATAVRFRDQPWLGIMYHWADGDYAKKSIDLGAVYVDKGRCRRTPFSGFPPQRDE